MVQRACRFRAGDAKGRGLDYLLFTPTTTLGRPPLVVFLHGAGERGDDLELLKRHGIPRRVEQDAAFPFVAVSPQCPAGAGWHSYARTLAALIDDVLVRHEIDRRRVYLTGVSMGGFGTWYVASCYPSRFAAIVPVAGYGLRSRGFPGRVETLRRVPVWAFHGARDPIVPVAQAQALVDALRARGGDVRFTVYPDGEHDSWTRTYENPRLYAWLLRQRLAPSN